MPRRFYSKLRKKHAEDRKDRTQVLAQKAALVNVGRAVRASGEGVHALAKAFYDHGTVLPHVSQGLKAIYREEKANVVVVGAGFAGLSAAYELQKSGQYNVIVVEAQERVGGRVWSVQQADFEKTITSPDHDFKTVERGGELIGLNHFFWLHYADELGLELDYLEDAEPAETDGPAPVDAEPTADAIAYQYLKLIYDELDEDAANLRLYGVDGADLVPEPWEAPEAHKLDGMSLAHYFEKIKGEYKDITDEDLKKKGFDFTKVKKFEYEVFVGHVNDTLEEFENNNGTPCAAQSLYFNLLTIGNGNRPLDKELYNYVDHIPGFEDDDKSRRLSFWDDTEIFRCHQGNMALALKFREHLEKLGGKVLVNTPVHEIHIKGDHVEIIVNINEHVAPLQVPDHKKISHVVLAMAPSAWHRVTFSPALPPIQPTMGNVVKYVFNVPPVVTENFRKIDGTASAAWANTWEAAVNDTTGATAVNSLAAFAGSRHAAVLVNPPHADTEGDAAARKEYVCDKLNQMRPDGLTFKFTPDALETAVFMNWPKTPYIDGGYSSPAVNEIVNMGATIHNPIHKKIHLAGEYACRYKWCGFMEGALISGAGAAKAILNESQ